VPVLGGQDAVMDLVCVTVDCADPALVAGFWSAALGWAQPRVDPNGHGAMCRSPSGGVDLEFVRVPEHKRVKNRVHLGCSAGPLERLDAEIERLQRLGATLAWEEKFPPDIAARYRNVVLRDVEGNEFCLGAGTMTAGAVIDEIQVRPARAADRSRVLDLSARLAEGTPVGRDRAAVQAALTDTIDAIFDEQPPETAVFVAEISDEVVGVVTTSRRPHFSGVVDASIDDLVVAAQWEGRGVARGLLRAAETWARDRGLGCITVETGASNDRAINLYRSVGFRGEDLRLAKTPDS
jgi:ribosomal protein S18 acetylase RimI-like enzyme